MLHMLELPAYPRFEMLEKKLLTAVRCGAGGFAFAVKNATSSKCIYSFCHVAVRFRVRKRRAGSSD